MTQKDRLHPLPGDHFVFRGCLRFFFVVAVVAIPGLLGGCAGTAMPPITDATPAQRPTVEASIREASVRFNIPVPWINAVMRQESGGRLRAVSPKGAMGLMQLMPATWGYLRAAHKLGTDPYDAHDNIIAGTAYLREMYDLYGSPGFLAAYNAGPGRYESCLRKHRPLPPETRHYVAVIAPRLHGTLPDGPSPSRPTAVAALPPVAAPAATPAPALVELASLEPQAPSPPSIPAAIRSIPTAIRSTPTAAPMVLDGGGEDDEDDLAPRPGRSPVTQARPEHRQPARTAAVQHPATHPAGAQRLPEHRPTLPPGWYVPVAYPNH